MTNSDIQNSGTLTQPLPIPGAGQGEGPDQTQPAPAPGVDHSLARVDLTVVIPAFNEKDRLGSTLSAVRDYASKTDRRVQVIVIDDGSTDGTSPLVRQFDRGPLVLQLIENGVNRGKGYSVRQGMVAATGRVVLMCDADMSTPIDEVDRLRAVMESPGGVDIVIGSRDVAGAVLSPAQPWYRRCMGNSLRWFRRRLLLKDLYDTQCGFKLFRGDVVGPIFAKQTIDRFAFDIEVLAIARGLGYSIREVGVHWHNDKQSRVRIVRDSLGTLADLIRIWRRWG